MHHCERRYLAAERLLIKQRAISLDVTGLLKTANAAQARRRRDADPSGQLHVGDSAVMLQFAQDIAVDGVQASHTFVYNGNKVCETLLRDSKCRPRGGTRKSPLRADFTHFLAMRTFKHR